MVFSTRQSYYVTRGVLLPRNQNLCKSYLEFIFIVVLIDVFLL